MAKLTEDSLRQMIRDMIETLIDDSDIIDEMSTTTNVSGYETPYAFSKKGESKKDWVNKNSGGWKMVEEDEDADEEMKQGSSWVGKKSTKQLGEGRRGKYHEYRDDDSKNAIQKMGLAMREARDKLKEVEKLVDMNLRLKQEMDVNSNAYWKRGHRSLNRIGETMKRLQEKFLKFKDTNVTHH